MRPRHHNNTPVVRRALGILPLVHTRRTMRVADLAETVDHMVWWDPTRCGPSPDRRVEALTLTILVAGRTPL